MIKDYWRNAVYYAYVVHKNDIEEGLDIVRKADRKDLEEELIDYLDEIHRVKYSDRKSYFRHPQSKHAQQNVEMSNSLCGEKKWTEQCLMTNVQSFRLGS